MWNEMDVWIWGLLIVGLFGVVCFLIEIIASFIKPNE